MIFWANLSTSTILLGSIAVSAFLVYLPYLVVAITRFQVGFDPAAPRGVFDRLPDYAKRATWAHENSFETFMIYSAAAIMAYVTHQESQLASNCAIAFVVSRFLYSIFYIISIPVGRSLMFGIGSIATYTLMVISIASTIG